jgi:hypothetical protein
MSVMFLGPFCESIMEEKTLYMQDGAIAHIANYSNIVLN